MHIVETRHDLNLFDNLRRSDQVQAVFRAVDRLGKPPLAVFLTQARTDHYGGISFLRARYPNLPVYASPEAVAAMRADPTWGGQTLNTLLAAVFARAASNRRFAATPTTVSGDILAIYLPVDAIRELARRIETTNDLPLAAAAKFVSPSRYFGELSDAVSAEEKRRSVPWTLFHRCLDRIDGIDLGGSMPMERHS